MKNLLTLREEVREELPNRDTRKEISVRHAHRRHHWGDAWPGNKVKRFLHSNVGQHWNEVYSKYKKLEWIPSDMRDLKHLHWYIIIDTFLKGSEVWYISGKDERPVDAYIYGTEIFFVHPTTRVLCYTKTKRYFSDGSWHGYNAGRPKAEDKTMVVLGNYHQLLKLDGIWYEVAAKSIKREDEGVIVIGNLYYREADVKPVHRWRNGKLLPDIAPADGVKYKIYNGKLYLPAKAPRSYYSGYNSRPLGPKDRIIEDGSSYRAWGSGPDSGSFKVTLQRQLNSKDLKKFGLRNEVKVLRQRCKICGGIPGKDCRFHICGICNKYKDDCKCYTKWF